MNRCWLVLFIGFCCLVGPVRADDFAPGPDDVRPILVGHTLPELVLQDSDGNAFDLAAKNAKSPLVVVFYRGYW